MNDSLIQVFTHFLEKQEILANLSEQEFLHVYSYSEVHCIDAIAHLEKPNVTNIAHHLKMTRGGISKITTKLLQLQLIAKYQQKDNKKEVYFRLCAGGEKIFLEHQRRHILYQERDKQFYQRYSEEQLQLIKTFMETYNTYLDSKIKEMEEI